MLENEKKWKKIFSYFPEQNNKEFDTLEKARTYRDELNLKLDKAVEWNIDFLINSNELIDKENIKEKFFINPEKFSYIEEPDLEYKYFKKLSYCHFEGVVPWGGKYIRIDKLQDYVPLENLEYLRL